MTIVTSPSVTRHSHAAQMPSEHDDGAGSPFSLSRSSRRLSAGHWNTWFSPSSVTSTTDSSGSSCPACSALSSCSGSTAVAGSACVAVSNGLPASEAKRSRWMADFGKPASRSAFLVASMNGFGPQMNASCCGNAADSDCSESCAGSPCTDSSQCRTTSRPGCAAASSVSSRAKMTDFSSRLA